VRKLLAGCLVAVILLGGLALWLAWPISETQAQGNTFCAANLPCTVGGSFLAAAKWTFATNLAGSVAGINIAPGPGTPSSAVAGDLAADNTGSNALKYFNGTTWNAAGTLPINLAGGASTVTGVLPGANMAATNLAGGNTNGGVTGILPFANLTTQPHRKSPSTFSLTLYSQHSKTPLSRPHCKSELMAACWSSY